MVNFDMINYENYKFSCMNNVTDNNGIYTVTGNGTSSYILISFEKLKVGDDIIVEFDLEGDPLEVTLDSVTPSANEWRAYTLDNKKEQKFIYSVRGIAEMHQIKIGHFTDKIGVTEISNIRITLKSRDGICISPSKKTVFYNFMICKKTDTTEFSIDTSFLNTINFTISKDDDITHRLTYDETISTLNPITILNLVGLGNGKQYRVLLVSSTPNYCTFRIVKISDESYVNIEDISSSLIYLSGTIFARK